MHRVHRTPYNTGKRDFFFKFLKFCRSNISISMASLTPINVELEFAVVPEHVILLSHSIKNKLVC